MENIHHLETEYKYLEGKITCDIWKVYGIGLMKNKISEDKANCVISMSIEV